MKDSTNMQEMGPEPKDECPGEVVQNAIPYNGAPCNVWLDLETGEVHGSGDLRVLDWIQEKVEEAQFYKARYEHVVQVYRRLVKAIMDATGEIHWEEVVTDDSILRTMYSSMKKKLTESKGR
jgi:hypothetical protein